MQLTRYNACVLQPPWVLPPLSSVQQVAKENRELMKQALEEVHACVASSLSAFMCVCVRACVHACVRACVVQASGCDSGASMHPCV